MRATEFSTWLNEVEWQQWRKARAAGLKAEEPATLHHPHARSTVAADKAAADEYRAISRNYAGLE